MNIIEMELWGRTVKLAITFDVFSNESILPIQQEAIEKIVADWPVVEATKQDVRDYCTALPFADPRFTEQHDIFDYITPKSIFAMRDAHHRSVALLCDCIYDPENGLAVIFQDEQYQKVVSQDDIL